MLCTAESKNGVSVKLFQSCISGDCQCSYLLGDNKTQLRPHRFAALTFVDCQPSDKDLCVFDCVVYRVDIVSSDVQPYNCHNYHSNLDTESKAKMDVIVASEIENGILSVTDIKPHCIHAPRAVGKPDGGIRPITNCSRPEGVSVNSNVDGLPLSFRYKSIDNVVELLEQNNYMSVIDIKNA